MDPNTDKTYSSCYNAIHEICEEIWQDENDLETPYSQAVCEAPEVTKDTTTKGRWLIPYTSDPVDSLRVLRQMIDHWKENDEMEGGATPTLNPPRKSQQISELSQQYLQTQRKTSRAHHIYKDNQYNKGRITNRPRPPAFVNIDNNSDADQPSWAQVVQKHATKPPHNDTSNSARHPLSHASQGKPNGTRDIISPTPHFKKTSNKATSSDETSQSSVATTMTSNRTDLDTLLNQMRQEHQESIRAYKLETGSLGSSNLITISIARRSGRSTRHPV